MKNTVLVTGGAGYIGSHVCVELLEQGYPVVVLDNLCNGSLTALERVQDITGRSLMFQQGDVRDTALVRKLLREQQVGAVIHFAGLKAVGESVSQPLHYYDNNVTGAIELLQAMSEEGVKTLVFSSSATVYGDPASNPIVENFPLSATNPYGRSKLMIEEMLRDLSLSDAVWDIAILRYFNPAGAHSGGRIGEHPRGVRQQPHALYSPDRKRPETAARRVWWRLPDERRHWRTRLHPCHGPRQGAYQGAGKPDGKARLRHV